MKPHFAFLLAAAAVPLLTSCAATQTAFAPVESIRYAALGEAPFWSVTIGDDVILLTLSDEGGRLRPLPYPRTLPRTVDGVTRWESGEGVMVISVEARPQPCRAQRGPLYRDQVVVRLSGRELRGCGGPIQRGAA